MAMNTRNKRASAIGVGLSFLRILPAPGGPFTQGDRQQAAWAYAGIAAGAGPAIPEPADYFAVSAEGRWFTVWPAERFTIPPPERFVVGHQS